MTPETYHGNPCRECGGTERRTRIGMEPWQASRRGCLKMSGLVVGRRNPSRVFRHDTTT